MINPGLMLRGLLLVALGGSLGGCLSFENSPTAAKVANLVMFQSTTPPVPTGPTAATTSPDGPAINPEAFCPPVSVADAGAALRSYGGQVGDSQAVRNQLAINDVARECTNGRPDGSFTLKIGVQGRVVIGPAGGPGSYQANLRMTVKRAGKVIATRVARVGATIAAGQGGAGFVHVEENIAVPPGTTEPDIEVSLDNAGAARAPRRR